MLPSDPCVGAPPIQVRMVAHTCYHKTPQVETTLEGQGQPRLHEIVLQKKTQNWARHAGGRVRQICEFEAGPSYRVSSGTARATQGNRVSTNKTEIHKQINEQRAGDTRSSKDPRGSQLSMDPSGL